jgi:predicted MFS family arabinose efflux permease
LPAITAPVVTIAARSTDRRIVVVLLTGLIVLSNVVAVLTLTFTIMLLGRILLGLCVGGVWTFSAATGRRLVPESAGVRATALIIAAISAGTVFGVPAGALIGEWAGWRSAFATTAVLSTVALIGQALLLPKLPAKQASRVRDIFAVFEVQRARIGFLVTAFIATGHFAAYTYLELFFLQIVGLRSSLLSVVLAAYGAAGLFGTFAGERALAWSLRGGFAVTVLLIATVLFLSVLYGANPYFAIPLVVLWGFAFGAVPLGVQLWLLSGGARGI